MKKKQMLGFELIKRQLIHEGHLKRALNIQDMVCGKKVGEILVEMGAMSRAQLMATFASLFKIPVIDLLRYNIDYDVVKMLPVEVIKARRVMPISRVGNLLTVAVTDPFDRSTVRSIELMTGCKVNRVLCSAENFRRALDALDAADTGAA